VLVLTYLGSLPSALISRIEFFSSFKSVAASASSMAAM